MSMMLTTMQIISTDIEQHFCSLRMESREAASTAATEDDDATNNDKDTNDDTDNVDNDNNVSADNNDSAANIDGWH